MSLSIFGFFFFRRNISSNIIIILIIFHVCNQYTKLRVGWIVNSIWIVPVTISSWFKRFLQANLSRLLTLSQYYENADSCLMLVSNHEHVKLIEMYTIVCIINTVIL